MTPARDYLRLHFIVLLWGFTAILGALITIPSVEIVFWRTLLAFIGLGILLKLRKRNLAIQLKNLGKFLGTGMLIGAHWILFFAAAREANVSVCLAGMATCSLWTSFLEPIFNKKSIRFFEVILGLLAVAGIWVIFQFDFQYQWGLLMAIISAFLGALFTVLNGKFTKDHNAYTITYYEMIGAWLGIVLFLPYYHLNLAESGLQLIPEGMDWWYLLILAIICTVYAYSESVELMKRLSAFIINLTVNLEPVYGIALALLIFPEREQMPGNFYLGTGLILLSVLIYPVLNRYYKRKPLEMDPLR